MQKSVWENPALVNKIAIKRRISVATRQNPEKPNEQKNKFLDAVAANVWAVLSFVLAVVILFFGLRIAHREGSITTDLFVDLGFSAAGALLAYAYNSLRKKQDDKTKANSVVSSIAKHRRLASLGRGEGWHSEDWHKDIIGEVQATSEYNVEKSGAKEIVEVLQRFIEASRTRWNEAFSLLAKCPEFHVAWNSFFVLQRDITGASKQVKDLIGELDQLSGHTSSGSSGENRKPSGKNFEKARGAWRPLQAALNRRDEAFSDIPSLGTLAVNGGKGKEVPSEDQSEQSPTSREHWERLARFWDLFKVVSTDMREAYLILYHIIEEKLLDEIEYHTHLCQKTLGACLERVRNCILILGNYRDSDDPGTEGNTTISDPALMKLVDDAKKLERGETIHGIEVLPASFGVMIRDLATAYDLLRAKEDVSQNVEGASSDSRGSV